MPLTLLYYGHPILRKKADPITEITDDLRKLVGDMIETMDQGNGIGLSAPQVGHSIRLFVLRNYIEGPDGHLTVSAPRVYINPKLSAPSEELISDVEGCLSLPGIRAEVVRPEKITVEAIDLDGKTFVEEIDGYNARVRMHENDHLNGVLYIDRIDPKTYKKIEPILKAIKKKFNP